MKDDDKMVRVSQARIKHEDFERDMSLILKKEKEIEEKDRKNLLIINEALNDERLDKKLVAVYMELQSLHMAIGKLREELYEYIKKEMNKDTQITEEVIDSINKEN